MLSLTLLDELGCLPIDKTGADLLFQIISQRYERGSIAITTNRVYKHWPEIFNYDVTLTLSRPRPAPPPCRDRDT